VKKEKKNQFGGYQVSKKKKKLDPGL